MKQFLKMKEPKLDPTAALTSFIVKGGVSLNFVAKDETLAAIFLQYMNYKIPNFSNIRQLIIDRAEITSDLIKIDVTRRLANGERPTVEFDEWTSISNNQNHGNYFELS